jgi:hypothetical protein
MHPSSKAQDPNSGFINEFWGAEGTLTSKDCSTTQGAETAKAQKEKSRKSIIAGGQKVIKKKQQKQKKKKKFPPDATRPQSSLFFTF